MNDVQRKKLDKLAKALQGVSPERLETVTRKTAYLTIRVTPSDKADIKTTAAGLDLSITDYLMGLHWFARDALKKARRLSRVGLPVDFRPQRQNKSRPTASL